MKNTKLVLLSLLLASFGVTAWTQEISNAGFETWTNEVLYENPLIYETSNFHIYNSGGEPNAIKTTDAQDGNYAIQLTTRSAPEVDVNGMAFIGKPGVQTILGGVPFNEKPSAIKAWVKYDVPELDTANIIVLFKTSTYPNGIARAQLTGTQSEYVEITLTPTWYLPYTILPDTVTVVLSSSTLIGEVEQIPGSTITIDNITFVGSTGQCPNGSFEDWADLSMEEPSSWITSNGFTSNGTGASVLKSTDSNGGSFASQLITQKTLWGDTVAFVANCYVGKEDVYGGMKVEDNPKFIRGYYKYTGVDNDSAHFHFKTSLNTVVVEEFDVKLGNVSEYTYFEIPFEYTGVPLVDTLAIAFSSSDKLIPANARVGSELFLDDLEIIYESDGVEDLSSDANLVYPNPSSDEIRFKLSQFLNSSIEIKIYNAKGQIVKQYTSSLASMEGKSMDISELESGMYFYQLISADRKLNGKFIIK